MKITKSQLKRIIKEEIGQAFVEEGLGDFVKGVKQFGRDVGASAKRAAGLTVEEESYMKSLIRQLARSAAERSPKEWPALAQKIVPELQKLEDAGPEVLGPMYNLVGTAYKLGKHMTGDPTHQMPNPEKVIQKLLAATVDNM